MQRSVDHSHDVALHEARHAAYAGHRGLPVVAVQVGGSAGQTDVRFPVESWQLQGHWEADPRTALHDMHSIAGSLIAPVASEGKLFRANADDAALLGSYARAWTRLRPSRATGEHAPAWLDVLADVRIEVRTWATAPGALLAVYELAHWLQREGVVDASGWAWLWSQSFARPLHQRQPAPAAPRTATAAVSARPAKPTISGLDIQYAWCLEDIERMRRSTPHADPNQRPTGIFQPHFLVARVA